MTTKIFKGWQAKIFINDLEVGCCKSVNVTYESSVEPYYSIDNPHMHHITLEDQLGLIKISGTLNRAWVNPYYLRLLFGGDTPTIPNFEFDLTLRASNEEDSPTLLLSNCRFTRASITIPQNGWLEEDFDFIAMRMDVGIVCPSSGEKMTNGDFQTGDWTGWTYNDATVESSPPDYYAYCPNNTSWISQDIENELGKTIPVVCVSSFTFYSKRTSCPPAEVRVTITYSDTSTSYHIFSVSSSTWTQFNIKPYLTAGKRISKVKFSTEDNGFAINDVSLMI